MPDTRNFAPPERMMMLCNKALDVIDMLVSRGEIGSKHNDELYSWLSEEVGMTDEEIKQAGFDCVPEENDKCPTCGATIDWDGDVYDEKGNALTFVGSVCSQGNASTFVGRTCLRCFSERHSGRREDDCDEESQGD